MDTECCPLLSPNTTSPLPLSPSSPMAPNPRTHALQLYSTCADVTSPPGAWQPRPCRHHSLCYPFQLCTFPGTFLLPEHDLAPVRNAAITNKGPYAKDTIKGLWPTVSSYFYFLSCAFGKSVSNWMQGGSKMLCDTLE